MRKVTVFFLSIFGGILLVQDVWAISVSPAQTLVTINPSEKASVVLDITNDEDKEQSFDLSAVGLKQDTAGRTILANSGEDFAVEWVSAENAAVKLPAKKSAQAVFNIVVPPNTPPGSHLVGLSVAPSVTASDGVGITGKVLSLLLIQVSGFVHEDLKLTNVFSQKVTWNNYIDYSLQLKNDGNIDLPIGGKFKLSGPGFFEEQKVINLGSSILPGAVRVLQQKATLGFWPGPYNIGATITYGRTNNFLPINFTVWYFPVWSIVVVFVSLLLFIWRVFKKKKNAVSTH